MTPAQRAFLLSLPAWLCVAVAVWFSGCFIVVALLSVHYPFALEWMEGQFIDVVARVVGGQPVYAAPSVEYVPFPYTPYYFYVSGFISLFTGVDFFPARLVSFAATLGSAGILYAWIRKENGGGKAALTASGLFLGTYVLSGRWFDIARVDSLFLFLNLAGLFALYFYRGRPNAFVAAALMAMAFFTKQTSVFILLPPMAAMLWIDRRHALSVIGLWGAMVVTGIFILNHESDGWFSFYAFQLSAGHTIQTRYLLGFWLHDLLQPLAIECAAAVYVLLLLYKENRKTALWYGTLAAGLGGCSYAARLNWGGFLNTLMPAHAALALLSGLLLSRSKQPLVPALVLLQMGLLLYNPVPLVPTENAREQGEAFLKEIAAIDGEILMPDTQFVQTKAGKASYGLGFPALDILVTDLGDKNYIKENFHAQLAEAVKNGRFSAIIPGRLLFATLPGMKKYYTFHAHIGYPEGYALDSVNFRWMDIYTRNPGVDMP